MDLNDYVLFPHVAQVFQIRRTISQLDGSKPVVSMAYGVTSLSQEKANASKLLEINRGHWSIENRFHYVRDVTYDEDRSRVRKYNGPRVMATLRNLAISIIRMANGKNIAKATRYCTMNFFDTIRLIGIVAA